MLVLGGAILKVCREKIILDTGSSITSNRISDVPTSGAMYPPWYMRVVDDRSQAFHGYDVLGMTLHSTFGPIVLDHYALVVVQGKDVFSHGYPTLGLLGLVSIPA